MELKDVQALIKEAQTSETYGEVTQIVNDFSVYVRTNNIVAAYKELQAIVNTHLENGSLVTPMHIARDALVYMSCKWIITKGLTLSDATTLSQAGLEDITNLQMHICDYTRVYGTEDKVGVDGVIPLELDVEPEETKIINIQTTKIPEWSIYMDRLRHRVDNPINPMLLTTKDTKTVVEEVVKQVKAGEASNFPEITTEHIMASDRIQRNANSIHGLFIRSSMDSTLDCDEVSALHRVLWKSERDFINRLIDISTLRNNAKDATDNDAIFVIEQTNAWLVYVTNHVNDILKSVFGMELNIDNVLGDYQELMVHLKGNRASYATYLEASLSGFHLNKGNDMLEYINTIALDGGYVHLYPYVQVNLLSEECGLSHITDPVILSSVYHGNLIKAVMDARRGRDYLNGVPTRLYTRDGEYRIYETLMSFDSDKLGNSFVIRNIDGINK